MFNCVNDCVGAIVIVGENEEKKHCKRRTFQVCIVSLVTILTIILSFVYDKWIPLTSFYLQTSIWSLTKDEGENRRNCKLSCIFSGSSGYIPFSSYLFLVYWTCICHFRPQGWQYFCWPQTCVKYCSPEERTVVFQELRPHFITLASNTYAVHLVTKMLDNGTVGLITLTMLYYIT